MFRYVFFRKMFLKMIVSFAIVALLSFCSPASSFALFLPRVSRTNDAVIIDRIQNKFLFKYFKYWLNLMNFMQLTVWDKLSLIKTRRSTAQLPIQDLFRLIFTQLASNSSRRPTDGPMYSNILVSQTPLSKHQRLCAVLDRPSLRGN